MADFLLDPTHSQQYPMDSPISGAYIKNLKEIKIGSGSYHTFADGRTEYRDADGKIVILIDPNDG